MRDRTEGEQEGERGREKKSRRDNETSVFQLSRSFVWLELPPEVPVYISSISRDFLSCRQANTEY